MSQFIKRILTSSMSFLVGRVQDKSDSKLRRLLFSTIVYGSFVGGVMMLYLLDVKTSIASPVVLYLVLLGFFLSMTVGLVLSNVFFVPPMNKINVRRSIIESGRAVAVIALVTILGLLSGEPLFPLPSITILMLLLAFFPLGELLAYLFLKYHKGRHGVGQ